MVLAFRSEGLRSTKLWKWLLGLLQYASIVILLLILWNPSRPQMSETASRNSVLVLFDTSQSMSVVEDKPMTRLEKALNVFEKKFRPSDPEGPDYRIYGFDRQCYWVPVLSSFLQNGLANGDSTDSLCQWGRQTNLHSALALLDRYEITGMGSDLDPKDAHKGGTVVGAVVFTDGQADDKSVNAYPSLRNDNLQVVLVGVGSKVPQSDVAIKAIKAPSQIAIDTAYTVQVVVTARNLHEDPVTLELLKDDYVIASRQLSADRLAQDVTVKFAVGADRLGRHTLSARAKAADEEVNSANNTRSMMVRVVENTRLKVLFYSQVANFNIGRAREALARDKKIQLDLGFDAIIRPAMSKKARTMCGHVELPADRAGFYKYDVIILGPCALDGLTAAQINGLYSFVVDRGGGLILLPGKAKYGPPAWRNEKAKALLPVLFAADAGQIRAGGRGGIKLTLEGIDSKVISQAALRDYDEWASAYYRIIDKKPAATTLATAGGNAIVCVHRVGRGRVCLVNVSELFRWYREDLEGGLLRKFMSGLTAYVGRVTNLEAAVELFVERTADQASNVKFDVYVRDKWFAPVDGATVLLNVGAEVLRMDQAGQGRYVAEVEDMADEAIIATVEAELDGTFLGEKTVAVNLPLARSEMDNVELDSKFLRALAKRLHGKYFDADDIDKDVRQMFEAATPVSSLARMRSVWPTWLLLLALCLLLSVNWFTRRAIGLV